MFDLTNLNDYEFEILCKDIMEKKLSKKLYTFPKGADNGVDICDAKKQIVIQVKHYSRSGHNKLYSSLRKEVEKIKSLNPKSYYVCTSLELTRSKKENIVELFEGYIEDISSIIDKIEIDKFLESTKNSAIVNKNFKLWLCATNIIPLMNNQDVFIDCEELICDIKKNKTLFVDTTAYYESRKKLIDNNIIIITGAPGVGKSTISNMLLLYFAEKGYAVHYSASNTISDVKKVISRDPLKKEIVLLDDFLGQHYLKIKESQSNELKTLLSFIGKNSLKKLIMNSRITIFNEAIQSDSVFSELSINHETNKYLIDLNQMLLFEKAKILYNHLYFNCPPKYFLDVKLNKNYLKIVQHKNYNPRIIEYVTQERNYSTVSPREYSNYIFTKLDNPEEIWKDEFKNRLDDVDRILMNTLYSLTDDSIEEKILESAFNKRIKCLNLDTSINLFKTTLARLTDSLLEIYDAKNNINISVMNPSINDYINIEMTENSAEQVSIISSAKNIEQILKVARSEDAKKAIVDQIKDGRLLEMSVLENSSSFYYLKIVTEWEIFEDKMCDNIVFSIKHAYKNLSNRYKNKYGIFLNKLLNDKLYDSCNIYKIFQCTDDLNYIIDPMDLNEVSDLFNLLVKKYSLPEDCIVIFKETIIEKIDDTVRDEENDNLNDFASQCVNICDGAEIFEYLNGETNYLSYDVNDLLEESIRENLKEKIRGTNSLLNITMNDFDEYDIKHWCDVYESIRVAVKNNQEDREDTYKGLDPDTENELKNVRQLFEK